MIKIGLVIGLGSMTNGQQSRSRVEREKTPFKRVILGLVECELAAKGSILALRELVDRLRLRTWLHSKRELECCVSQ